MKIYACFAAFAVSFDWGVEGSGVEGSERKGRVYRENVPKGIHFSERDGLNMGDTVVL